MKLLKTQKYVIEVERMKECILKISYKVEE
jgi:hypothetical protein